MTTSIWRQSAFLLLASVFSGFTLVVGCSTGAGGGGGAPGGGEAEAGELGGVCYGNGTCNSGLVCDEGSNTCEAEGGLAAGESGGACYGNGTCNTGLVCNEASNTCEANGSESEGEGESDSPIDAESASIAFWADPLDETSFGQSILDVNDDPTRLVLIDQAGRVVFSTGDSCNDCTTDFETATIDLGGDNFIDIRFGRGVDLTGVRRPFLVDAASGNYIQLVGGGGDSPVTFQVTTEPFEEDNDDSDDRAVFVGLVTPPPSFAGGGDPDPLPEFQLGAGNDELDADVAAITTADNQALDCLAEDFQFSQEEVLLALKGGYVADDTLEFEFPVFVGDLVVPELAKVDEICDTTVDNASEELLGWLDSLTAARNEGAACLGEPATLTNENSLELLKTEFFDSSVGTFAMLLSFAEEYVPDVERTVAGLDCL